MAKRLIVLAEVICTVEDDAEIARVLDEVEASQVTGKEAMFSVVAVQLCELNRHDEIKAVTHATVYDRPLFKALLKSARRLPQVPERKYTKEI